MVTTLANSSSCAPAARSIFTLPRSIPCCTGSRTAVGFWGGGSKRPIKEGDGTTALRQKDKGFWRNSASAGRNSSAPSTESRGWNMPEWRSKIQERLASLNLPPAREAEIVEELYGHLQDRYDELRNSGTPDEEACRIVTLELSYSDLLAELQPIETKHRGSIPEGEVASGHLMTDFWRDFSYAMRVLRKAPGFTLVAILTLALGIGANTAVFTIINTFLLNPLPVTNASRTVAINTSHPAKTGQSSDLRPISFLNLKDCQEKNRIFGSLTGYSSPMATTLSYGNESHRAFVEVVTGNYFDTLGIYPVTGRFFSPEEDTKPRAYPVVVIGYAAWQGRFGAASDILGRTITLNKVVFTIIGVAPKGF